MNILVISDSHGWTDQLKAIMARHENEVDQVIHVGDSELPEHAPELAGVKVVAGNCDVFSSFPNELECQWEETAAYIAHGHHHGVKQTLAKLIDRAKVKGARIAIYGHSHIARAEEQDGVILINPGSVRLPKQYPVGTYCCLTIGKEHVDINYWTTDGQKATDLDKHFTL